jgi:STE24 endopeptidase
MLMTLTIIYAVYIVLKIYVSVMQIGYISEEKNKSPFLLNPQEYQKAGQYAIDKERLAIIESIVDYGLFFMWVTYGLAKLEMLIPIDNMMLKTIVFVQLFVIINYLITMPFELYQKFVIDEKYGFNQSSIALFIQDTLKSGIILLIVGSLVIWGISAIILSINNWWIWSFAFIFTIVILINMLYPTLIAPIFNKMSPLENEELRAKIETLLGKVGFSSSGVFVLDASKRDSRLNAYFGGFGKTKRVVLFDTLIEKLEHVEILAVLGHELGHFQHGDIYKNIGMMALMLFSMFFIFGNLPPELFIQMEMMESPYLLIALFLLVSPVVTFIILPIMGVVSRHNEYEADKTGAELGGNALYLAEALKKLVTENKAFPKSHPLQIFFYYTHPPVIERLKALGYNVESH